jgi:hypothetical protein
VSFYVACSKFDTANRPFRTNSFSNDSKRAVFLQFVTDYIPSWAVKLPRYIPTKKFLGIRKVRDIVATKAERLVQEKVDMYMQGFEGSKDVISLLVRANAKEGQKGKLSDAEMNGQIALVYTSFFKSPDFDSQAEYSYLQDVRRIP